MKKKILIILALGILLRLFLAFGSFHSDVQPFYFAGSVIAEGNVLNFYDYLGDLPKSDPILKIYPTYLFNYPPVVYFFLGPIAYVLSFPFNPALLHNFIYNFPSTLGNVQLNLLLLVLKIPYLPFDLLTGLFLYKLFKEPSEKLLAFGFWMFNPINLYATYMMGQFDVIPTFFAVSVIYLINRRIDIEKASLIPESIILGLGAAFKIFPFMFLIPLALLKKNWWDRIKIITVGLATYAVSILPFLSSGGFRSTALIAGQTTKSLYPKIDISGGESLLLFPLFLIFFYVLFLYRKSLKDLLWQKFFVVLLLFFVFTHYHPQWFLWLTPFLIIDLVKSRLAHWPLALLSFISWLGLVTFFDPGLSVWLFSPLFPNLYNLPGIWQLLKLNVDLNLARSVLQTLFAGTAVYYIYYYFSNEKLSQ